MAIAQPSLTLEEFLRLPEEKPALEFEAGRITQKVSPKGRHSTLQLALCELFNRDARPRKLAYAFPELGDVVPELRFVVAGLFDALRLE